MEPARPSLFGDAVAADRQEENRAKRTKLKNIDSVAAKCLEPWGKSIIHDLSLPALWNVAKAGDKYAAHFTNLAMPLEDGGYRVGIGISQTCEIYLAAIKELEANADLQRCLDEGVLKKATDEAAGLKPVLNRLNAGKAFLKEAERESTFGNLKRRRQNQPEDSAPRDAAGLAAAATILLQWLQKGAGSNLRMVVHILSAGGVFYAADAADKTARAWATCSTPPIADRDVLRAAQARQPEMPAASSSSIAVEKPEGDLFGP